MGWSGATLHKRNDPVRYVNYGSFRNERAEAQAAKAERREARRAAKRQRRDQLRGAPIEGLPDDYQGLARTLSYGE